MLGDTPCAVDASMEAERLPAGCFWTLGSSSSSSSQWLGGRTTRRHASTRLGTGTHFHWLGACQPSSTETLESAAWPFPRPLEVWGFSSPQLKITSIIFGNDWGYPKVITARFGDSLTCFECSDPDLGSSFFVERGVTVQSPHPHESVVWEDRTPLCPSNSTHREGPRLGAPERDWT